MFLDKILAKLFPSENKKEVKPTSEKSMKHLEIFQEIDQKIHQMCHEVLKEGGIYILPAVNQLANALTQIMQYKKPVEANDQNVPRVD